VKRNIGVRFRAIQGDGCALPAANYPNNNVEVFDVGSGELITNVRAVTVTYDCNRAIIATIEVFPTEIQVIE
jgi:hypothetical protein